MARFVGDSARYRAELARKAHEREEAFVIKGFTVSSAVRTWGSVWEGIGMPSSPYNQELLVVKVGNEIPWAEELLSVVSGAQKKSATEKKEFLEQWITTNGIVGKNLRDARRIMPRRMRFTKDGLGLEKISRRR
jgi:hypothetical protein